MLSSLRAAYSGQPLSVALLNTISSEGSARATIETEKIAAFEGGCGSDGEGDGDDIFEDPTVERERRRRLKRHQHNKQEQPHQQQVKPTRGECCDRVIRVGGDDNITYPSSSTNIVSLHTSEAVAAMSCPSQQGGAADVGPEGLDNVAGENLPEEPAKKRVGIPLVKNNDRNSDSEGNGGKDSSASIKSQRRDTVSSKASPGIVAAGTTAAVLKTMMACGRLADLSSQVPDILCDESVAAVVLAATTAAVAVEATKTVAGRVEEDGLGVPEMSIIGRRLNREVCGVGCGGTLMHGMV